MIAVIVVFLPLLSFIISGLISFYTNLDRQKINFLIWVIVSFIFALTSVLSIVLFASILKGANEIYVGPFLWIVSGSFVVNFGLIFDIYTSLMVMLISFISLLVYFYSYFYLSVHDNMGRFLCYMSLFSLSMIILVTSDNLLQMFIGWEGISLSSYLLIAFWYKNTAPIMASSKAFLINRAADITFLLAIFVIFALFRTTNIEEIIAALPASSYSTFSFLGYDIFLIDLICVLFLIAAFAKSAQIGLHIWLPDAMEAPTPVSALLHAATMVVSGIFLVVKLSPLFQLSEVSSTIILFVSSITAIFAAAAACVESNIKRIIAYSTISQLGYMFLALAVFAYNAAIFHLVTHAFFKALLFLAAGNIIHSLNGELNIFKMGRLWNKLPFTYLFTLLGIFSLIGVTGFSGYYSKEVILYYLYTSDIPYSGLGYVAAVFTVILTTIYCFRLLVVVFHQGGGSASYEGVHKSSYGSLFVLLVLSLFSVFLGGFITDDLVGVNLGSFWNEAIIIHDISRLPIYHSILNAIEYQSWGAIFIGVMFVYFVFIRYASAVDILPKGLPVLYSMLQQNLYFDKVYLYSTNLLKRIASNLDKFENKILDYYLVGGLLSSIFRSSRFFSNIQNGYLNFYAVIMVFGAILLVTYCFYIFIWGVS